MRIGEVIPVEREIELNAGKKTVQVKVVHTGDRPVQVGSHFHFFEVNKMLQFDRTACIGFRLDVPSEMLLDLSQVKESCYFGRVEWQQTFLWSKQLDK